jgi:hypothetical protein
MLCLSQSKKPSPADFVQPLITDCPTCGVNDPAMGEKVDPL